jgi:uncharacterized membrane-anchored protein YhcB (DUF1043 family)
MMFLTGLILLVVGFIAGWVVSFFVMRNNPKYFNLDKMAKEELYQLKAKLEAKIEELKEKI